MDIWIQIRFRESRVKHGHHNALVFQVDGEILEERVDGGFGGAVGVLRVY